MCVCVCVCVCVFFIFRGPTVTFPRCRLRHHRPTQKRTLPPVGCWLVFFGIPSVKKKDEKKIPNGPIISLHYSPECYRFFFGALSLSSDVFFAIGFHQSSGRPCFLSVCWCRRRRSMGLRRRSALDLSLERHRWRKEKPVAGGCLMTTKQ